jgi:hypothetical protein
MHLYLAQAFHEALLAGQEFNNGDWEKWHPPSEK